MSENGFLLVVGLGNPGRKYEGTRHNVGFRVLWELGRRHGSGGAKSKFESELLEANLQGKRALLLSPLTYMNASGRSVRAACNFYQLDLKNLLVICDDINLPLAKLRFRAKGSAGGQKGLNNIIQSLGTEEFARLRIGVAAPPSGKDTADYVLQRFAKKESSEIDLAVVRAADAVADWADKGLDHCMNEYN